jgi:hypothetical protein
MAGRAIGLAEVKAALARRLQKTNEVHDEVAARRRAKKQKYQEAVAEAVVEVAPPVNMTKTSFGTAVNFGEPVLKNKDGQNDKEYVNWYQVHEWFREGMLRNDPKWILEKKHEYRDKRDNKGKESGALGWCEPEKNCARRLLAHYGIEVTRQAVDWLCDNWKVLMLNSGGSLTGAPSVRLLWTNRERYFLEAVAGRKIVEMAPSKKKKRQHIVGEYDAAESERAGLGIGWGNM